jgi:hypothetical protein
VSTPTPQIVRVLKTLGRAIRGLEEPAVEKIAEESLEDPFQVLISTMLSAQTRDPVTAEASARLFRVARTPRTMAALPVSKIQKLIYPVSFYRVKARSVKETCRQLMERFGGRVPATMEELLTLPGVGTQDRESCSDPVAREPRQHLRGHTRAPDLEPAGLGADKNAGPDRAGALSHGAAPVLAQSQSVPGDVGTECLPARVSSLPGVRGREPLCEGGRG